MGRSGGNPWIRAQPRFGATLYGGAARLGSGARAVGGRSQAGSWALPQRALRRLSPQDSARGVAPTRRCWERAEPGRGDILDDNMETAFYSRKGTSD